MKAVNEYAWKHIPTYRCWALEGVSYCEHPTAPHLQYMNIYVPETYMNEDGLINPQGRQGIFTAATAPVVFENGIGGYSESKPDVIGEGFNGPKIPPHLEKGFIYVAPGSRGRQTKNSQGEFIGRAPLCIVDLKAAIRYLKANRKSLPGNMNRIVSIGFSAGGAMSALLGVTGDQPAYLPYLEEIGAVMTESDRVYAAQCYVPVMDLDHADLGYEWDFAGCDDYTGNMFIPAGTLTPFQKAVAEKLAERYAAYFKGMELSVADMDTLRRRLFSEMEKAATKHLHMIEEGLLPGLNVQDYLSGRYAQKKWNPMKHEFYEEPGLDHSAWMQWDGSKASLASMDTLLKVYRKRVKGCPAFDELNCRSFEAEEFGPKDAPATHFSTDMPSILDELKAAFPIEYQQYREGYGKAERDETLPLRKKLMNPITMLQEQGNHPAAFFRIRMGARDAETAFAVPFSFALNLEKKGIPVDYALVWDAKHEPQDCGDELYQWIENLALQ